MRRHLVAVFVVTLVTNTAFAADRAAMARAAAGNATTTMEKVRAIVAWTNRSFEWTYTDYKTRTVDEIIERKGGNCDEQARVAVALMNELGIRTRKVKEINVQPENEGRQKRAEARVVEVGPGASVFGLRHNDHVWTEFWDDQTHEWTPADPTLNLVGFDAWIRARVGFGARPTHPILASRDMLVPVALFAVSDKALIPRAERYLIDGFNTAYSGELEKLPAWRDWVRAVVAVQPSSLGAFEGRENLHTHADQIAAVKSAYDELQKQYAAR